VAQMQVDTPSANQCRISRNETSYSAFSATLTATVTYQNDTIAVLTKNLYGHTLPSMGVVTITNTENSHVVPYQLASFSGAVLQPNVRYEIMCTHFPGMNIISSAPSFVMQGLTFRPIDDYIYEVIMPQGGYLTVQVTGGGCYEFSFSLGTSSSGGYLLNLSPSDGSLLVELQKGEDEAASADDRCEAGTDGKIPLDWTLEVYNATNSKKMATVQVTGNRYTLDTLSWEKGIYIVRAVIGKEILSEKISIKQNM